MPTPEYLAREAMPCVEMHDEPPCPGVTRACGIVFVLAVFGLFFWSMEAKAKQSPSCHEYERSLKLVRCSSVQTSVFIVSLPGKSAAKSAALAVGPKGSASFFA